MKCKNFFALLLFSVFFSTPFVSLLNASDSKTEKIVKKEKNPKKKIIKKDNTTKSKGKDKSIEKNDKSKKNSNKTTKNKKHVDTKKEAQIRKKLTAYFKCSNAGKIVIFIERLYKTLSSPSQVWINKINNGLGLLTEYKLSHTSSQIKEMIEAAEKKLKKDDAKTRINLKEATEIAKKILPLLEEIEKNESNDWSEVKKIVLDYDPIPAIKNILTQIDEKRLKNFLNHTNEDTPLMLYLLATPPEKSDDVHKGSILEYIYTLLVQIQYCEIPTFFYGKESHIGDKITSIATLIKQLPLSESQQIEYIKKPLQEIIHLGTCLSSKNLAPSERDALTLLLQKQIEDFPKYDVKTEKAEDFADPLRGKIVSLFLEKGADPRIRNLSGNQQEQTTPFHSALLKNNFTLVDLFSKHNNSKECENEDPEATCFALKGFFSNSFDNFFPFYSVKTILEKFVQPNKNVLLKPKGDGFMVTPLTFLSPIASDRLGTNGFSSRYFFPLLYLFLTYVKQGANPFLKLSYLEEEKESSSLYTTPLTDLACALNGADIVDHILAKQIYAEIDKKIKAGELIVPKNFFAPCPEPEDEDSFGANIYCQVIKNENYPLFWYLKQWDSNFESNKDQHFKNALSSPHTFTEKKNKLLNFTLPTIPEQRTSSKENLTEILKQETLEKIVNEFKDNEAYTAFVEWIKKAIPFKNQPQNQELPPPIVKQTNQQQTIPQEQHKIIDNNEQQQPTIEPTQPQKTNIQEQIIQQQTIPQQTTSPEQPNQQEQQQPHTVDNLSRSSNSNSSDNSNNEQKNNIQEQITQQQTILQQTTSPEQPNNQQESIENDSNIFSLLKQWKTAILLGGTVSIVATALLLHYCKKDQSILEFFKRSITAKPLPQLDQAPAIAVPSVMLKAGYQQYINSSALPQFNLSQH